MRVKELKEILESTSEECQVYIKVRLADNVEIAAPLQHAYVMDIQLGEVSLTLEIGKVH